MRIERTVLVLGAGASVPYGFPTGFELKELILKAVQAQLCTGQNLRDFHKDILLSFHETFSRSAHPTIDQFLEKKAKFRELGALLIATVILGKETRSAVNVPARPRLFPHNDWYAYLFESLGFEDENPDVSFLSIVTLNYDRSLEQFLRRNIDYNCHDDRELQAHKKREQIRIVHAHGSLGKYPDFPYGGDGSPDSLTNAAKNIKIVSDNLEDAPDFKAAQQLVAEADRVVFLGFGYHERVVRGLFAKTNPKHKLMCGSAMGVDDNTRKSVSDILGRSVDFGQSGQDASAFIRGVKLIRSIPDNAIALGLPR